MKKKIVFLLVAFAAVAVCIFASAVLLDNGRLVPKLPVRSAQFSFSEHDNNNPYENDSDQCLIKAAILYQDINQNVEDSLSHLTMSSFASMKCYTVNINDVVDAKQLEIFDIIYPDESIIKKENKSKVNKLFENYVSNGGNLFLTNAFVGYVDNKLLGIKSAEKIDAIPQDLENCAGDTDALEISEIVCDFAKLYNDYKYKEQLSQFDYGFSVDVLSAKPLVKSQDKVIYCLNEYKNGSVLLTNPLLPNVFSINGYSLEKDSEQMLPFAFSTASANTLIKGEFASFVSKKKHGFSVEKTYGSFGSNPISWQLHYEEITGIENDSAILFSEICKKHNQIPSFTLIRNTYKWFSRYETVSYLELDNDTCIMDYENGAYSNGKHIVCDGKFFSLAEVEDAGSYFVDYPEYTQRAVVCFEDLDRDGICDMISSSSDGYIYFAKGSITDNGYEFFDNKKLCDVSGKELCVGAYSSAYICDYNTDGFLDIVSGSMDGQIVVFYGTQNLLQFSSRNVILTLDETQTIPVFADITGDGQNELVVGTLLGNVYVYDGKDVRKIESINTSGFVSPCVYDFDNDGLNDVVVGTFDGYCKVYLNNGTDFVDGGYIQCNEKNYKGNSNVKFGNNCTPRFFDIDCDGKDELVCSYLEYGLNVPIDSEFFEYAENLQKQVDYINDNNFYLGTHFYTNEYASPEREKAELELHKKAFEFYGIDTENTGANQHTWYVSTNSDTQSFESLSKMGLLWDSGFQSSKSIAVPQASTENVFCIPFFTSKDKDIMILNTGTLLYLDDSYADITAKYNLPLEVYYHCDFAYETMETSENNVKKLSDFANRNNYSFVREDQLVKASAAAQNTLVNVKKQNNGRFTLSAFSQSQDFPLFDKDFASCVGVRVEFSQSVNMENVSSNATVSRIEQNSVYVSLDKPVDFLTNQEKTYVLTRIESVNVPAKIVNNGKKVTFEFLEDGFMSVTVKGKATADGGGWKTEHLEDATVFLKYGESESLTVNIAG